MDIKLSPRIEELHKNNINIDGHCDTLMKVTDGILDFGKGYQAPEDPCEAKNIFSHIDLPRLIQGGTTTQTFACFIEKQYLPGEATKRAMSMFDALYSMEENNPDQFEMVRSAADIRKVKAAGKVGGFLALEGAESLEGEIAVLRNMYRLGLRQVGLTWNWRNQAADGLGELRTGGGLTEFGVDLVKEANRLGIILDIAHLAPTGVKDILEISEQPIVDSHCGAKSLTDHVRNLDDAQLDGVAKNGGLVCVTFVRYFISDKPDEASIEDVLNHIDYISKRIGVEHVGIGSDYDGIDKYLAGLEDVSKMPALTAGLAERGYSDEEITKIMGGNYLRIIEQVCK